MRSSARSFSRFFSARRALLLGVGVGAASWTSADEGMKQFQKLEHKFRQLSQDMDRGLTVNEFMVALAPEYLAEEATAAFASRKPESFSSVLRDAGDLSGNKLVGFAEYAFFTTLLSVPMRDMGICFRLFDEDGSGTLDHDEFLQVVSVVTKGRHNISRLELPSLFGRRGKVSMKDFLAWTEQIKKEVARIEFDLLDQDKDGRISALQFGQSLTGYGSRRLYEKTAHDLQDSDFKLSFDEFWQFQRCLEDLNMLDDALRLFVTGTHDAVSRAQFRRAVSAVSKVELPEAVVETLFVVFNENGKLCRSKFYSEMDNRIRRGSAQLDEEDLGTLDCFKTCWNSQIVVRETKKT